jgi:SAM-dependent methyltransferase
MIDEHPSAHGKVSDRNLADLKRHYDVERALGDRLRTLPAAERRAMYGRIYNELFARVPDHPQLTRKVAPERQRQKTTAEFRLLRKFITPDSTFLEIGAGDGAVSLRVAEDVKSSVDVAYSNQVIEHLHPEDAALQMSSLLRILKPGGSYVCVTPNRLNGPHDISMFFDTVATGLHMKEYTYREMDRFFRSLGFDRTGACLGIKGRFAVLPIWCAGIVETALSILPTRLRMSVGRTSLFEKLLFIRFVAYKPR